MKDAIFIWIPKNAGTSIARGVLKKYNPTIIADKNENVNIKQFNTFPNKEILVIGHLNAMMALKQNLINKDYWEKAFKFTFVRNPWSRIVSAHNYLKTGNKKHFYQFCSEVSDNLPLHKVDLSNGTGMYQIRPQVDWVTNKKRNLIVDFVGKVENIQEDWKKICEEIEIEYERVPIKNKKTNISWKKYYENEEGLKKTIEKLYKDDIELFNYTFEEEEKKK